MKLIDAAKATRTTEGSDLRSSRQNEKPIIEISQNKNIVDSFGPKATPAFLMSSDLEAEQNKLTSRDVRKNINLLGSTPTFAASSEVVNPYIVVKSSKQSGFSPERKAIQSDRPLQSINRNDHFLTIASKSDKKKINLAPLCLENDLEQPETYRNILLSVPEEISRDCNISEYIYNEDRKFPDGPWLSHNAAPHSARRQLNFGSTTRRTENSS